MFVTIARYGLLSKEEIQAAFERDSTMPISRTKTSVPFVGKVLDGCTAGRAGWPIK